MFMISPDRSQCLPVSAPLNIHALLVIAASSCTKAWIAWNIQSIFYHNLVSLLNFWRELTLWWQYPERISDNSTLCKLTIWQLIVIHFSSPSFSVWKKHIMTDCKRQGESCMEQTTGLVSGIWALSVTLGWIMCLYSWFCSTVYLWTRATVYRHWKLFI